MPLAWLVRAGIIAAVTAVAATLSIAAVTAVAATLSFLVPGLLLPLLRLSLQFRELTINHHD